MRIGRILFTSIQKDNSMKPTRNRIFCPQCKRPKMLFESQKKADNFIEFNKSEIEENNRYAPCRSYYCPFCAGWHVTHHQNFDESRIEDIDTVIENYKNCSAVKLILSTTEQNVEDILDEVKKVMKEGDYEACGRLLRCVKNLIETFKNKGKPTNRQINIIERYVRYDMKVNVHLGIFDVEDDDLVISRANRLIDELHRALKTNETKDIENTLALCQKVYDDHIGEPERIKHLGDKLCVVHTILACRKGVEAVMELKEIDTRVLIRFLQDKFKELELNYTYQEYSYCAMMVQTLFKLYQLIADSKKYPDKIESIRMELYQWVEKLHQTLKQ